MMLSIGREAIFPTDWLAPGEVLFCAQCGWKLRPKNLPVCESCINRDRDAYDKDLRPITPYRDPEGTPTHQELDEARKQLAESRRSAGVKPLFWMD